MYGQTPSGKPKKDTTAAVNGASAVRYRVLQTTFVNGRLEKPEREDGSPNFVLAAAGLASAALRLEPDQAEIDRLAAEKAEADRLAAEKAEADRVAAEKAEADRRDEADRLAAEKAEAPAASAVETGPGAGPTEAPPLVDKPPTDRSTLKLPKGK